jgi:hypothetical protein
MVCNTPKQAGAVWYIHVFYIYMCVCVCVYVYSVHLTDVFEEASNTGGCRVLINTMHIYLKGL